MYQVRSAQPSDYLVAYSLLAVDEDRIGHISQTGFQKQLAKGLVAVVEVDEAIIGVTGFNAVEKDKRVTIYYLAIYEGFRDVLVGFSLLNYVHHYAQQIGAKFIVMGVREEDRLTAQILEQYGFEFVEEYETRFKNKRLRYRMEVEEREEQDE